MDDRSGSVTTVQIFNHSYDVRSSDPEYVQKLAKLLDHKMREVAELTPTVDTLKVAILAALNLADECLTIQKQLEKDEADASTRIERMMARLSGLAGESR